uniref:Fimbrial protein n=1 Tax=Yersinia enterocolitica TaxID=630 RepID=F2Q833_YEREN|nr:hypothetical protein Y69_0058 [Yersinia enterocolitica]
MCKDQYEGIHIYNEPKKTRPQIKAKCSMKPQDVYLPIMRPGEKGVITNNTTTISCTGTATVRINTTRKELEFTPGAVTKITTEPSSGILKVAANKSTPIPLVFNTTVSSNSEAGEYTQSLVVTAEIQ